MERRCAARARRYLSREELRARPDFRESADGLAQNHPRQWATKNTAPADAPMRERGSGLLLCFPEAVKTADWRFGSEAKPNVRVKNVLQIVALYSNQNASRGKPLRIQGFLLEIAPVSYRSCLQQPLFTPGFD